MKVIHEDDTLKVEVTEGLVIVTNKSGNTSVMIVPLHASLYVRSHEEMIIASVSGNPGVLVSPSAEDTA